MPSHSRLLFPASLIVALVAHSARSEDATTASTENGRKLYAVCQACHESIDAPNRGPTLRNVVGRAAGSVRGFPYSRAMKMAARTWNDATLDAFLANPQTAVPGTNMPFPGMPAEAERRDLVAYLKTLR